MGLWDVFRNVGGVLGVLTAISGSILKPISKLGYNIKAISTVFSVKTNDKELLKNKKFHVNTW